jgi:hypothetical protein
MGRHLRLSSVDSGRTTDPASVSPALAGYSGFYDSINECRMEQVICLYKNLPPLDQIAPRSEVWPIGVNLAPRGQFLNEFSCLQKSWRLGNVGFLLSSSLRAA